MQSGEVRSWWQARIAELERDRFFRNRYTTCAKEPKALFDRIGEDLDSTNEKIREAAFWVLVHLTPELTNILHEKETRMPGWKDREGQDQKIVNEGLDGSKCILKHLHTKLVKEHDFKVLEGNKKDPRPYLKETIKNWEIDHDRKRKTPHGDLREVALDNDACLELPDPAGTPEDYLIEAETYYDLWTEYKSYFRDRNQFNVFYSFYVDDSHLEKLRAIWGMTLKCLKGIRKTRDPI